MIPPTLTPRERGDLHAELDRLDRELETMRARLAREQGQLHDARARCRALSDGRPTPPPDGGDDAEAHGAHSSRRLARTSRIGSTLSGSRPPRDGSVRGPALRAIAGGDDPARVARARRPVTARDWNDDPPDAA